MNTTKITVLNCPVNICTKEEALDKVRTALEEKKNYQIVTINPEMIMNAQKNNAFLNILNNSDLNIADGIGVELALKLKGISQDRIRGVDLSRSLIKESCKNKLKIGFLGAEEEVIQKVKEKLLLEFPNLNLVFCKNGYFDDEKEIIEEIRKSSPQILLVGLGSPKQEELISKLKSKLNGCVMIGIGGSFDVFAGKVKEAPLFFQKTGLEWLYRTIKQPERFKRIFPVLPIFLLKCIIDCGNKKG